VIGRAAHRERSARDLEHRHVVDPVADRDGLVRRAADPPAQLRERRALRRARRAHEHRVLAGALAHRKADREQAIRVPAQHRVRRLHLIALTDRDRGDRLGLPRELLLDDIQVRRPRADVAGVRRTRVVVMDALRIEHEAREPVRRDRVAQHAPDLELHRVVRERGVRGELDEVTTLGARDHALDRARRRGPERAGLQAAGDDGDRDPGALQLADGGDVVWIDLVIGAQ
jgi:hypothetical protein